MPGARAEEPRNPPEPIAWDSLSSGQQRLLGRFEQNWAQIPAGRQQALARGSERYLAMTPDEQERARGRFKRWQDLPDTTKARVRDRWQQFQSLSPAERDAVRRGFQQFRALPVEKRRELMERWRDASQAERRQMLENLRQERQRRAQHDTSNSATPKFTTGLAGGFAWLSPFAPFHGTTNSCLARTLPGAASSSI